MFTAEWLLALALLGADAPAEKPLPAIRRICVEPFAGDSALAAGARDAAIASLFAARRFTVLEKCDSADAVLKGSIIERATQNSRSEKELTVGAVFAGSEGLQSSETRFQATIVLRLVSPDGVVLWANSQDSPGGKGRSAIVDAVDRNLRQFFRAIDVAGKNP